MKNNILNQSIPISLVKYIDAPATLVEGVYIIKRLSEVLAIIGDISDHQTIQDVSKIKLWIASCNDYLSQSFDIKELHSTPLRGLYEDHQPYVSLWHRPIDPDLKVKHNLLLAQLLIANSDCRHLEGDGECFDSSRKSAFTFARSICKDKYSQTLSLLPGTACSTDKYLSKLECIENAPRVTAFIIFIRYALGLRKGIIKNTSECNNHLKNPASPPVSHEYDPDTNQEYVTKRTIRMPIHTTAKEKLIDASGLSSYEFMHPKEYVETSFTKERPMDGRSSREHLIRTKSSHQKIAMNNQHLQSRWSVLSSFEASCIAVGITKLYRASKNTENEVLSFIYLETSALLTIMFWFSIPFDEAVMAIGHSECPKHPKGRVEFVLDHIPYLLIKTAQPEYKSQYRKYKCLDIASHVSLSSGVAIEQIISTYFLKINKKRKMFQKPVEYYQTSI